MFLVKAFWFSFFLILIITFFGLGFYGIPSLQVTTYQNINQSAGGAYSSSFK